MSDSVSEQIWQKYKDSFRFTDYSKYQAKKFYEPINIDKEVDIFNEQKKQKEYESEFPYYDDLPRLSRRAIYPFKGIAKMEHYGYFGIFVGLVSGKTFAQVIYGPLITSQKVFKTRAFLCAFFSLSFSNIYYNRFIFQLKCFYLKTVYISSFAQDFQPQNSGINTIQHYDEIVHRHYDLTLDAYRDIDNIKYHDQRIEKKDVDKIEDMIEQKKLEYLKKQLFHQV